MNHALALPAFGPLPEDLSALGLPANALLLLDKLRFFYCRAQPFCWPSDAELVRRTGLSIHQVRRALRRLEHAGLIRRQTTARRLDDGRLRRRRFIDILFTAPSTGAQPDRAPARSEHRAPARNQEVIVEGRVNSTEAAEAEQRPRPRSEPTTLMPPPLRKADPPMPVHQEAHPARQHAPGAESPSTPPRPASAPSAASPPTEPAGAAMARVFAKLGLKLPALTPTVASPSVSVPTSSEPPAVGPRRRGPGLSDAALEARAGSDPILAGELARRRAARAAREEVALKPPPATTAELLGRIREDPAYVPQAAQALAEAFDDPKSWRGLHAACRRAFEGELEPEALVYAYGKALGPQARNRGAIFQVELKHWRGHAAVTSP